jgi:hypothetical protein
MKKMIIGLLLLTVSAQCLKACDICGCGVGSYYIGILPDFKKRFLGLRYQYKTLRTHIGPGGAISYLTTAETYQTAELWGGWNIGRRFRVLGFVPLNFNERDNQGAVKSKTGPGDIALIGYYQLLDKQSAAGSRLLVQSLWVGAGVKLPTGRYEPEEKRQNENTPNNFQLGTGSTDFTLNAMYDIRLQDVGLNANISYKVNTDNRYAYRYGNKFTANLLAYYKIRIAQQLTLAPNAGALFETAKKDIVDGKFTADVSGGYSLLATAGVEATWKSLSIGGNFQPPVSQELAAGRVKAGNRVMVHATLLF